MVRVLDSSLSRRLVIRKPEITKKIRTPRFPMSSSVTELAQEAPMLRLEWAIMTKRMETARSPSKDL